MIAVLVVEHPPAVRRTLCDRLALEPDLCVVGEASDAAAAVRLSRRLHPRIVLLDAEMPDLDLPGAVAALRGIEVARLVILTLHPAGVSRTLALGDAYVVGKHEGPAMLIATIRRAAGSSI